MCTVTFVRAHDGSMRVVFNRDEQIARAASLPPRVVPCGPGLALLPFDPVSGGAWIGVNDSGLTACLLNATPAAPAGPEPWAGRASRGSLVPGVLALRDLTAAEDWARRRDPRAHPPFRFVVCCRDRWVRCSSDGHTLAVQPAERMAPREMLTSSGLGDHLVERPRRDLFAQVESAPSGSVAGEQDRFHRRAQPDRGWEGVLMSRADARTVSRVTIELRPHAAHMIYELLGVDPREVVGEWRSDLPINPPRAESA